MNKVMKRVALLLLGITILPLLYGRPQSIQAEIPVTMNVLYPDLTPGILTYAKPVDLSKGLVLRSDRVEITAKELENTVAKAQKEFQTQLNKNLIFLLEQAATEKILLNLAKDKTKDSSIQNDDEIIRRYLETVVSDVKVSEEEIKIFYESNKDMCGGASFSDIKGTLQDFVLQQKKQEAVTHFIKNLGQTIPISVSASWIKEQAILAQDNPVDKARISKKPLLVDFGADGCRPCDMMTPVLASLRDKYAEKLNVLFIHVQKEQILASRYGIQSIPVQVFFDKDGKEIFRHTGFFPQNEIEKKLSAMGIK